MSTIMINDNVNSVKKWGSGWGLGCHAPWDMTLSSNHSAGSSRVILYSVWVVWRLLCFWKSEPIKERTSTILFHLIVRRLSKRMCYFSSPDLPTVQLQNLFRRFRCILSCYRGKVIIQASKLDGKNVLKMVIYQAGWKRYSLFRDGCVVAFLFTNWKATMGKQLKARFYEDELQAVNSSPIQTDSVTTLKPKTSLTAWLKIPTYSTHQIIHWPIPFHSNVNKKMLGKMKDKTVDIAEVRGSPSKDVPPPDSIH